MITTSSNTKAVRTSPPMTTTDFDRRATCQDELLERQTQIAPASPTHLADVGEKLTRERRSRGERERDRVLKEYRASRQGKEEKEKKDGKENQNTRETRRTKKLCLTQTTKHKSGTPERKEKKSENVQKRPHRKATTRLLAISPVALVSRGIRESLNSVPQFGGVHNSPHRHATS